jgi:hypothetical protein
MRRILEQLRFSGTQDFEALAKAQQWLESGKYSYGAMQADAPTGILRGDVCIAKWRNLSRAERMALDGIMDAPNRTYRTGPVTITLYDKRVQL